MTAPPLPPLARIARGVALGLALTALPAAGQSIAASESGFVPAHGTAAAGRSETFSGNSVDTSLGQALTGAASSSPNFTLESGVAWVIDAPDAGPLVTGTRVASGDKQGGEVVHVFGANFLQTGAGVLSVELGGQPATSVNVLSDTEAVATTPPGMDAMTNPLTDVEVSVSNAFGSHAVPRGFRYTPALVEDGFSRIGGPMRIVFQGEPSDLLFLALGKSVAGFGVGVPPFEGKFQVVLNVQLILNAVIVPSGVLNFSVNVPDDPNLVGGTLKFQAFAAADLLAGQGGVSNLLPVTFLP